MNERILELSEQAHRSTADELAHLQRVHNRTYDLNESAAIYNEKIAQLIVKECEKVAKNPQWYSESRPDGWLKPINHVCNVMKQHFGVEE